jgi:hypothetical protein
VHGHNQDGKGLNQSTVHSIISSDLYQSEQGKQRAIQMKHKNTGVAENAKSYSVTSHKIVQSSYL